MRAGEQARTLTMANRGSRWAPQKRRDSVIGKLCIGLAMVVGIACTTPAASGPSALPSGTNPPLKTATVPPTAKPYVSKTAAEVALTLSDIPAGFVQSTDQVRTIDDVAKGFADPVAGKARLIEVGFASSHSRTFSKSGFGLQYISSIATLYNAADGARNGVMLNAEFMRALPSSPQQVSLGQAIGEDSIAFEATNKDATGNYNYTTYSVYFRYANASNTLAVTGIAGLTDVSVAIDLAKKQLARQMP